ncbi:hypothetical protein CSC82_19445 [Rhodobacteraceae bacterium 4F10]|nr:hypothetical protein CSC82_19445 [Rhodobacteraceae bacterium 4F10]
MSLAPEKGYETVRAAETKLKQMLKAHELPKKIVFDCPSLDEFLDRLLVVFWHLPHLVASISH